MKHIALSVQRCAILIITLFLFLPRPSFAQSQRLADLTQLIKERAIWDPAQFVLAKLATSRVVMVADAGHGDPLYTQIIVNSLNEWITRWEVSTNPPSALPSQLFLVLEMDSVRASGLNLYFETGDPITTIDPFSFIGNQFTTGTLAFYSDLRAIKHRIDLFNKHRRPANQICLEVIGPEFVFDQANWTPELRDSIFVYGRDEHSFSVIKELLIKRPDAKALLYYGSAHLYTEKVQKLPDKPQSMGYYLGHYLKEQFDSAGGFYTMGQADVLQNPHVFDASVSKIGKTFALENSLFTGHPVDATSYVPWQNATIYYFASPRITRHISHLFSERLVNYIFKNIDAYRDISKDYNRWVLDSWLAYLFGVRGLEIPHFDDKDSTAVRSKIDSCLAWHTHTQLDIVSDIASLSFFKRVIDGIRSSSDRRSTEYQRELAEMIRFRVWFQDGATPQTSADSLWSYILRYRKPIVLDNLIDLLWVGSDSEKSKAIGILKEETGLNFEDPKQWSSWWQTQLAK